MAPGRALPSVRLTAACASPAIPSDIERSGVSGQVKQRICLVLTECYLASSRSCMLSGPEFVPAFWLPVCAGKVGGELTEARR